MTNPFELIEARLTSIEALLLDLKHPTPPAPPSDQRRIYGDRALAEQLGCTPLTVAKGRKSGRIPVHRYGARKFYYILSEVDAALKVEPIRRRRSSMEAGR